MFSDKNEQITCTDSKNKYEQKHVRYNNIDTNKYLYKWINIQY